MENLIKQILNDPEQIALKVSDQDLVYRLLKRADIRRNIPGRKSVEEGKSDRISDLLEEAAIEIIKLKGLK
jgi:hypothetical protein